MGHSNMDTSHVDISNPVQGHSEWSGSTAPTGLRVSSSAHPGNCPATYPMAHNRHPHPDTFPNTGYHLINPGPHSHPNLVLQLLALVRRWGSTFTKLLLTRLPTSVFLKAGEVVFPE